MKLKFTLLSSRVTLYSWFRYLDECQILLKVNWIKPEHLHSILNQVNDNVQFTMKKSQTRLPFLDIMMNKSGTKSGWIFTTNATDSKRYVLFTSNHPQHCLANIPLSFARRTFTIVENENVKEKCFKELRKTLVEQKYPKSLIEASILELKKFLLKFYSKEIISFIITYNPNNPNVFLIVKHSFDSFQYSKTMSNIFQGKKLVKSMSQAPNLGRLLCRSKFKSQQKNHEVKNCGKNCVSCPYFLKASSYQFKQVKTFLLKNSFNCESSDTIYVAICRGCKEEYTGEMGCPVKEQINIYRQHIRQS